MRFLVSIFQIFPVLLITSSTAKADVYTFNNSEGDYVVSQNKPTDPDITYAVLSDDGEFIRLVKGRREQIPVGHWRPSWLPKVPNPLDGKPLERERVPTVTIEEERAKAQQ